MQATGLKASFCATGQTGVLISQRGIAIDAVISDFISGAAEWLSPETEPGRVAKLLRVKVHYFIHLFQG